MYWEAIDISLLLPPLLAAILVLATHVPLGRLVLQRGIIFIDLAIAQLAGLGVIFMHTLHAEPALLGIQLSAFSAALGGALGLRWVEHHWPEVLEAVIGVVFVLAVTTALLLLADDPHGGEQLKDLLAGQLLWVTLESLIIPAVLTTSVIIVMLLFRLSQRPLLFYCLFAVAVTTSVQLVGVYLVFATLIIPALGGFRRSLTAAYLIGAVGYSLGLLLSILLDLPTGPVIVWGLAITAIAFRLLTRGSRGSLAETTGNHGVGEA